MYTVEEMTELYRLASLQLKQILSDVLDSYQNRDTYLYLYGDIGEMLTAKSFYFIRKVYALAQERPGFQKMADADTPAYLKEGGYWQALHIPSSLQPPSPRSPSRYKQVMKKFFALDEGQPFILYRHPYSPGQEPNDRFVLITNQKVISQVYPVCEEEYRKRLFPSNVWEEETFQEAWAGQIAPLTDIPFLWIAEGWSSHLTFLDPAFIHRVSELIFKVRYSHHDATD